MTPTRRCIPDPYESRPLAFEDIAPGPVSNENRSANGRKRVGEQVGQRRLGRFQSLALCKGHFGVHQTKRHFTCSDLASSFRSVRSGPRKHPTGRRCQQCQKRISMSGGGRCQANPSNPSRTPPLGPPNPIPVSNNSNPQYSGRLAYLAKSIPCLGKLTRRFLCLRERFDARDLGKISERPVSAFRCVSSDDLGIGHVRLLGMIPTHTQEEWGWGKGGLVI